MSLWGQKLTFSAETSFQRTAIEVFELSKIITDSHFIHQIFYTIRCVVKNTFYTTITQTWYVFTILLCAIPGTFRKIMRITGLPIEYRLHGFCNLYCSTVFYCSFSAISVFACAIAYSQFLITVIKTNFNWFDYYTNLRSLWTAQRQYRSKL